MPYKLMKPKDCLERWLDFVQKCKPRSPGSRAAKKFAKLGGMKSMGEIRCAADMDEFKQKWEYEVDKMDYKIEATYNPDFTMHVKRTKIPVYIEYKGKMTQTVRTKMAAVKKCNPDARICIVFEKSMNKLSSRPKSMRYWRWAELNGFPWSEQKIKPEWLNETFWKEFNK